MASRPQGCVSPQGPSVCNSPITPCSLNSCRVYIGSSLRGERAGQGHPTSPFPTFQGCGSWLRGAGSLLAFLIRIHLCSWELHVSGGWGQGWGAEVFDCWMVWPWGFPLPLALCGLPPPLSFVMPHPSLLSGACQLHLPLPGGRPQSC